MQQFLAHLGDVSASPLALIAYLATVVIWGVVLLRTSRIRTIARALSLVPESQRKELLEKEYGFHLKAGMSSVDFLRAQRMSYQFYAFLAVVGAALIIVVAAFLKTRSEVVDKKQLATCDAIQAITDSMDDDFRAIRGRRAPPDKGEKAAYESLAKIPGTTYDFVKQDGKSEFYLIETLYFGNDTDVAYSKYNDFIASFRDCTTDWIIHRGALDPNRDVTDYVSFVKDWRKVIISIDRDTSGESFVHVMFVKITGNE